MAAKPKKAAKPKTPKSPPKEPKPSKKATAAAKKQADTGKKRFDGINENDKALFLHHLPKIVAGKDVITKATNALRTLYKTAKIDGFLKADFDVAILMQGAEGEKAKKAAIARDLTIARWLGFDLGAQLDLFVQDERVPAEDRAYGEGQTCSMEGKSPKPEYHPSSAQFRSFMQGYNDDQERIAKGIKPLDPVEPPPFDKTEPVTSGVAMTRADFEKQQAGTHKVN